jgi:hypothetical protein
MVRSPFWLALIVLATGCSTAVAVLDGGDAGTDAGADAGPDGGLVDAGWDAGADGGTDAGDGGPGELGDGGDGGQAEVPFCVTDFGTGAVALDDAGCPPLPPQPDLLDEALAQVGLDRCTFAYLTNWHLFFTLPDGGGGIDDPFVLPYFNVIHDHPLLAPSFARNLASDLDSAAGSAHPVSQSISALAGRLGKHLFVCDESAALAPDAGDPQPLAHAVAALIAANGGTPDERGLETSAQGMPLDLQAAVATLVNELARAPQAQQAYLAGAPTGFAGKLQALPTLVGGVPTPGVYPPNPNDPKDFAALAALDLTPLAHYAAELAATVESLQLTRFRGASGFAFSASTPLGAVVVGDGSANRYEPTDPNLGGNILLLLDTGGDDIYRVPVGANRPLQSGLNAPAALAIDLGGSDDYGYDVVADPNDVGRLPSDSAGRYAPVLPPDAGDGPISLSSTARQGAGVVGVGMLFDYGSEPDHYQSLRLSQGFGAAGVGVLFDEGGDDVYDGEALVQGAATFGIGLLLDLAGNDTRRTYTMSQGFGYTAGVGALVDLAGDDSYLADVGDPAQGGDPLYFSPQLPGKGNSTLAQGTGFGQNDFNGQGLSGGLGVLRDAQGNDRYQGSVFAQACGYYLGFGVLIDSAGNDQYDALWYTQGSAAHYAMSFFWDESGDDQYQQNLVPVATGPDCGHDFSVGIHVDNGGNDTVRGAGLCIGEANDLGTGLYINNGGTDAFEGTDSCFGYVTNPDYLDAMGKAVDYYSYGVFLKAGGQGSYTGNATAAPGTTWIQPGTVPHSHGIGIDRPDAGSVQLP